jgi:hypothetical protein
LSIEPIASFIFRRAACLAAAQFLSGQEIVNGCRQAMVLAARAPDAATEDEIVAAFRAARSRDFEALAADAAKLMRLARQRPAGSATPSADSKPAAAARAI